MSHSRPSSCSLTVLCISFLPCFLRLSPSVASASQHALRNGGSSCEEVGEKRCEEVWHAALGAVLDPARGPLTYVESFRGQSMPFLPSQGEWETAVAREGAVEDLKDRVAHFTRLVPTWSGPAALVSPHGALLQQGSFGSLWLRFGNLRWPHVHDSELSCDSPGDVQSYFSKLITGAEAELRRRKSKKGTAFYVAVPESQPGG